MKKFWIKMCSLVLLLFLIGGYNTVLAMREQRDEIARLTAELEGSKMTVSALKEQQAKTTENTAAEALKGQEYRRRLEGRHLRRGRTGIWRQGRCGSDDRERRNHVH